MKPSLYLFMFLSLTILMPGCKKDEDKNTSVYYMEVILKNTTFKTNDYLRIPYTLKTWEWKKNGLSLRRINILDDVTKAVIQTLDSLNLPVVHMDPIPTNPIMTSDKISSYYFSIQLPVPVDQQPPERISHQLVFRDTVQNTYVTVEGGVYAPDYAPVPLVIASPVKGTNWMFINQSTNDYHFYTMMFIDGKIGTGERFAFDNMQIDDQFNQFYFGDPGVNESYFCYRDTLFAVADGIVVACRDTMVENDGNLHNHLDFKVPVDYAGNYMVLDIGNGLYAMYAHCVTGSVMVSPGDTVHEGQPMALLGNSGNSDAPHLHFQVGDSPDFFICNGIPFVLKKYTRIGMYQDPTPIAPVDYFNLMNEQFLVISF